MQIHFLWKSNTYFSVNICLFVCTVYSIARYESVVPLNYTRESGSNRVAILVVVGVEWIHIYNTL